MAEKNMQHREMRVISREKLHGDATVVAYGYGEDGSLLVSEEVCGPSASVAYGERAHKLRAIFSPGTLGDLATLLGEETTGEQMGAALRAYFRDGSHALIDLMDLCDSQKVPYAYQSFGSATGVTYRPSLEGPSE